MGTGTAAACAGARAPVAVPVGESVDSATGTAAGTSNDTDTSATSTAAANVVDPRFAALVGFCDQVPAVSEDERADHRERIRTLAAELGYAAVIMEAGVNLLHFSGLRWWLSERPLLYVLPASGAGEAFFVSPAFEEGTLRQSEVGQAELRTWHEHVSPYPLVTEGLAARGIRRDRVAVDPNMRAFVSEGLRQAAPQLELAAAAEVFDGCRMRKQAPELARMRRANQATKAALALVAEYVEPGMSEAEVTAMVRGAQEAAGLSQIWALVAFGEHAAYPHGSPQKRPLRRGDLVLVDTGGSLHGYQSDITRTWPVGPVSELSAEVRKAWDTVLAAQSAAMDKIGPGAMCGDVDAAARAVMARAGYGADYERFTHRLGHGIGREVHEEPYLVRGSRRVLEPGMTMSNEPGIYVPGALGVRIEDIVAVTDSGHEVFGPRAQSIEQPF